MGVNRPQRRCAEVIFCAKPNFWYKGLGQTYWGENCTFLEFSWNFWGRVFGPLQVLKQKNQGWPNASIFFRSGKMGQPDKKGSIQNSDDTKSFLVLVEHRITRQRYRPPVCNGEGFFQFKNRSGYSAWSRGWKSGEAEWTFSRGGKLADFLGRQKWIFWRADKKDHLKLAVTGTFVCDFDQEKQKVNFCKFIPFGLPKRWNMKVLGPQNMGHNA